MRKSSGAFRLLQDKYVMAEIPLLPLGHSQKESLTLRGRAGPTEQVMPALRSETQIQGGGMSETPLDQKCYPSLQNYYISEYYCKSYIVWIDRLP